MIKGKSKISSFDVADYIFNLFVEEGFLRDMSHNSLVDFSKSISKEIMLEVEKSLTLVENAKKRIPTWNGSSLRVVPEQIEYDLGSDNGISWTINVYVGSASFMLFENQVEDVLEDWQDFRSQEEMMDYQNLIMEIRSPNSTKKSKLLTLYTAQPKNWNQNLKGIFLTSDYGDALGMAQDKGREVFEVSIPSNHVIETKSGRVRWYQVISEPQNIEVYRTANRVAAEKKKVKNKDGEEVEIYVYSDAEIKKRHKEKSEKVEKLRKSIEDLEKTLKKDLDSEENSQVALAVALINHTYERVGNDESAENGHFGVTGWQKKHIKFNGDKATLTYTGKSGVDHVKDVTDKKLVKMLKDLTKEHDEEDCILMDVSSTDVNEYLKQFGVTAKDLRGYHANREVQERLQNIRKENGKLPEDKKEKEKQLKEEFKQAIDEASEVIGHESATLRNQYLVPHMEETFLKDGTVITSLKMATKSDSEKEQEEDERLVRPSPKKKPPRKDKRRNRVEETDSDADTEQDKKDRSNNYKDASYRVFTRYLNKVAIRHAMLKR